MLHRRRGVVMFVLVVALGGGAFAGAAVYGGLSASSSAEAERAAAARTAVQNARRALVNYMLSRANRPFNIARPVGRAIAPRLLMLPCPDNIGDHNLDGTQDPTCGAAGRSARNITNGVLSSGARFGRLPHRQRFSGGGEAEVSDGLGGDFRGGGGLWYALSRNFAPSLGGAPLNLHRLDAQENEWLAAVRFAPEEEPPLMTINARVAAVVLSPGRPAVGRLSEEFVATASLTAGDISASAYFESAGGESNADADGVFVFARSSREESAGSPRGFDDHAGYIGMDELLHPGGRFMRDYLAAAGANDVHNAPAEGSPLAEIRRAVADWKNFFGFYPTPAANAAAHIDGRARHCAAHHSAAPATVSVSDVALLAPAEIHVQTIAAAGTTTTLLLNDAGFLTASAATATAALLAATVADNAATLFGEITLARYARLTLPAGATIAADAAATASGVLPPGTTVVLSGASSAILAARSPLPPDATSRGWLPEHHRTTMTISRDGATLNLRAPTVAGFLGGASLTSAARSLAVSSRDRLLISGAIRIEKDFADVQLFYGDELLIADGATTTLRAAENYAPDAATFARRRFVVLLLSDVATRGGGTVFAPQVLYPWRDGEGAAAITRDNLHPYPPCFDSRALPRRARVFAEDQNIYYAVSPDCNYSGACGGAMTVSVAAGVRFAAPSAFALTNSFAATAAAASLTIENGEVREILADGIATNALSLAAEFAVPLGAGAMAVLPAGFVFRTGEQIVAPAAATIVAGTQTRIEDAEAVMIYSPAPLAAARCLAGMNAYIAATMTLAAQGGGGANLTNFCQWLDEDENADGDLSFLLRPPSPPSQANDYFLFFGGRVNPS